MLALRDVTIAAGNFTLENIHLAVGDGEFHVILGPTGTGKTLLLETVAGLLRPVRGEVWLENRNVTAVPPERRGISYVPQDLALFPHLTVRGNVMYGIRSKRSESLPAAGLAGHVDRLVRITGIGHLLDRHVGGLSGGERQRVALVRGLATRPRLLIMDEPLSALHPTLRWELHELLRDLHREFRTTVLMVTHDLEDAFALAGRVSVLIDGSLHQAGSMKDLYRRPPDLPVARFFGIRNIFAGTVVGEEGAGIHVATEGFGTLVIARDMVPAGVREGQRLQWGIHGEEVTIVIAERKHFDRRNLLRGTILRIAERGRSVHILFRPDKSAVTLEIAVPLFALDRLNVGEGREAEVQLKEDKIFLIPE